MFVATRLGPKALSVKLDVSENPIIIIIDMYVVIPDEGYRNSVCRKLYTTYKLKER